MHFSKQQLLQRLKDWRKQSASVNRNRNKAQLSKNMAKDESSRDSLGNENSQLWRICKVITLVAILEIIASPMYNYFSIYDGDQNRKSRLGAHNVSVQAVPQKDPLLEELEHIASLEINSLRYGAA